jgi:hypothetical protein
MDFKAFFRRWGLMAVTAVCAVLIGIGFRFDIFGYDTYLPDAEKIAGIAIKDNASDTGTQYSYFSDTAGDEMEMFYTDREVIYDFLQAATAYERDGYPRGSDRLSSWNTSTILARVTLTNGRSYDRYYTVASTDNEAAFTILTSEEYQNASCRIPETEIFTSILVRRNGLRQGDDTGIEEASQIRDAFNLDLAENPELMVSGGGSLLCKVTLSGAESNRYFSVYDSMTHTVEALRENGFGSYVEPLAAEDIQEIWIGLNIWQSDVDEDTDLVQYAADMYGVELDDDLDSEKLTVGQATKDMDAYATEDAVQSWEDDDELGLTITDPEEIEELLGLASYDWGKNYENAFWSGFTGDVRAVTKDGEQITLFMPNGVLPEKYILRCGELK